MNIKEVAELFDLTTATIRYWEDTAIIPPIRRNSSGYRDFSTGNLNWIYLVKSLRRAGVTIESLQQFAALAQEPRTPEQQAAQKAVLHHQLTEVENSLSALTETRDLLRYKIDSYDDHVAKFVSGEWDEDTSEELWKKD